MKVLISVTSPSEAIEALIGGADIVDVKDPTKGSLGPPDTTIISSIIRSIRDVPHINIATSVALGDDPTKHQVKEMAFIAEELAIDYAKTGSLGLRSISDAVKAYRDLEVSAENINLVAVAYADYRVVNCLSPIDVLRAAYLSDFEVFMIDTLIKNGMSTFDYLSVDEIVKIRELAHEMGLLFALAGSLKLSHVEVVQKVKPDIVGFRAAACGGDRIRQKVTRENVRLLVEAYKRT